MYHKYNRLYKDLAWLWPLWEDVDEYRDETGFFCDLIRHHSKIPVHNILDIGCGGGKNMYFFKKHFQVTGMDISEAMLVNAKKLNPECELIKGDMRDFNLQCKFDAVFINDAIMYMTNEEELRAVYESACSHLKEGGVIISYFDVYKETFQQNMTRSWNTNNGDREIVFIENEYDPDPEDCTYEATFIYIIRRNGRLQVETDCHILGLFEVPYLRKLWKDIGLAVREEKWPGKDLPVFVGICQR